MTELRAGSVCSGYGGLEMGLSMVLDFELTWVADVDSGASKILAHRYPDVPNLGDITAVDWDAVKPVDILLAGFPCTDISDAGLGAGILEGNRSGVWYTIARAIGALRPRLVVLENVRRIVTRRPGLEVVLASLTRLGFDAEWLCLPASDVGAAHERYRWFCLAWPSNADRPRLEGRRLRGATAERDLTAADAADLGHERGGLARGWRDGSADCGDAAADAYRHGRERRQERDLGAQAGLQASLGDDAAGRVLDWGKYTPAIQRWERILGRPVPAPTIAGSKGQPKLSPYFDEWHMGLPAGWVTDVPDLTVNQMLHAIGNGVVPFQAAYATAELLDRMAEGVAA